MPHNSVHNSQELDLQCVKKKKNTSAHACMHGDTCRGSLCGIQLIQAGAEGSFILSPERRVISQRLWRRLNTLTSGGNGGII